MIIMYLDVCLRGEFVLLVLEIERVEPLIEREVEAKVNIWMTSHCFSKCTYAETIAQSPIADSLDASVKLP